MIRIKKLMARRFAKPAAVALASLGMLIGGTGTADAAIYWNSIYMVDQQSQACLGGSPRVQADNWAVMASSCMYYGTDQIYLHSIRTDDNGHARVWISTPNPDGLMICLTASAPGTGPNGPASVALFWQYCNDTIDTQVWTMITAAPPQNVGNPVGLKHFINFYNQATKSCLDGGIGPYGFAGDCSTTNNWQIWNIYTNQGSSPYTGQ